jgi:hypothetical protein
MARSVLSIVFFFTILARIRQSNLRWPLYGGFISAILGCALLISAPAIGWAGYAVLSISLIFESLGTAALNTLRESLVAIYVPHEERSGVMAILQTTVMLVSVPFGYIGGLLSDISRALPFVLSIALLSVGILATTVFYRSVREL